MPTVDPVWIFLGLSVLFGVLATREYLHNDHQLTVAGRNWRRMGIIFAVVALVLLVITWPPD